MSNCQFALLFCLLFVSFANADEDIINQSKEIIKQASEQIQKALNSSATLNVSFVTIIMALFHAYFF